MCEVHICSCVCFLFVYFLFEFRIVGAVAAAAPLRWCGFVCFFVLCSFVCFMFVRVVVLVFLELLLQQLLYVRVEFETWSWIIVIVFDFILC